MRVLLTIAAALVALAVMVGVGGWLFLRNSSLDHVKKHTRVTWPDGSRVVSVDSNSSFMSDRTAVVVELDAADVPDFLARHPSLQPCPPPEDAGVLCASGDESGPDWSVLWAVRWEPGSRRLTEEVSGFW